MKSVNIYFSPEECRIITMWLAVLLEDIEEAKSNINYPWTPESRKDFENMYKYASNAANKIEKFTGIKSELPPYIDGDEDLFFTKKS